jgi:hypothetical protein
MRETALEGRASSKREMRVKRGDADHSVNHLSRKARDPASMVADLLRGSGLSKSLMREESGEEAPKAASFARASTASLPAMPTCAGPSGGGS